MIVAMNARTSVRRFVVRTRIKDRNIRIAANIMASGTERYP
jgi:hypothetical protein